MFSTAVSGRKLKKGLIALTLFVFTFVILCPRGQVSAITLSEEKDLGKKFVRLIRKSMPFVEDGEVLTYVRNIGNRVAKEVGITTYQFQFFVVDAPVPNAFAVPGGYIFIYRGLIEMMSSEGELASILSHELGHITARHLQRSIDEAKILSIGMVAGMIAGILLGPRGLRSEVWPAPRPLPYSTAGYTRRKPTCAGSGIFVRQVTILLHMPSMMQKLMDCTWLQNSTLPSYLSTHPAVGERVQYLNEMVKKRKASSRKAVEPPSGDFQVMQATLIADYTDPTIAFNRFQEGIKKGDNAAVFGLGRLYLRQNQWFKAVEQLRQAAHLMPTSPFVLSSLGEAYHRAGKLQEAQNTLESALMIDPSSSIADFRLALVLMDMGKKDEALEHLMRIEELAPMFPEVDYQLGVILDRPTSWGRRTSISGAITFTKTTQNSLSCTSKRQNPLSQTRPRNLMRSMRTSKSWIQRKRGFSHKSDSL